MDQKKRTYSAAKLVGRVIRYMLHYYKYLFLLVVLCILITAVCTVVGATFPQTLVDDYITPMLKTGSRDFTGLAADLRQLACIMGLGVITAFTYNRIMVNVSQGTMRRLRDDLFRRMEALPIKYFDTHAHGDIMSVYTNDVDTLRQLLSQSIPQIINSLISMAATLVTMIILNPALTVISILTAVVMLMVTTNFSKLSGKYYVRQQIDLGAVDGFIEEMLDGQKVVKVFCHEQAAMEDFHKVNEKLRDSANKANRYANLLMPINANIGWISYALVAIVGAILGINGLAGVTIGTVVTFVGLNKSFTNPITQVSQQINFVVNAAAGAQRVFDLMDQEPEEDEGYVELVYAKEDENGTLTESPVRTNLWAWKHPHKAEGTVTYRKLEGGVVFDDVDFGYTDEKIVLHNISLWAKPGQKIAFVGATGAGKTTITNLINRFYDIADGKIRYDDININKIKKPDLRRSLGIVLQDTHLFTGTVMENIRYGKLDATDEDCINQCGKTCQCRWLYPEAAGRVRHHAHRRRRQPKPGPAAAPCDRPGGRGRPAGADPGRSHLLHRHPHREAGAGRHGRPDERQDHLRHRPPALHRQKLRLHHGHGAGADHRAWNPRSAD